jgi:serine protease Do
VADHLLEYGEVKRAYLGVKLDSDFDFETARSLELFRIAGARVLEVYPNTPAARARIQYNDVIIKFNGREVRDESHLINMVCLSPIGKTVSLQVWREGASKTITMDLIPRPGSE